jgi:uncharacterized DUF497 family protein
VEYEWDDNKNQQNQAKHGIDFYDAVRIFMDIDRIEVVDDRKNYRETRYRTVGTAFNVVLTVVYTMRSSRYRLISARKASRHEREAYYHQKS